MKQLRFALTLLFLSTWALPGLADAEKPVRCSARMAYEGAPLYSGPVELPAADFALGTLAFPDPVRGALSAAVEEARKLTGAPALTAAVGDRTGFFETADDRVFYWASVGKAVTATVTLQLVAEGKLSLDAPLAKWFPKYPHAALITIDDLLSHTSGLFSANEDRQVRDKPRYRTPEESIAIAKKHGALFCPGQNWRYSNTGYTFLGLILEAVEGRPYGEIAAARIFRPLSLASLRAVSPEDPLTDLAPLTPKPGGEAVAMSPSWAYAAGNVVGRAGDLLRLWHALLTGKLLSRDDTAARFRSLYPMFDSGTFYGRG
ncbi:MAG: serine hydrolase domain-containing protein, partial [Thermoanaerobaculia bacterium]|nr:serine hydrolase domain-containing protein [Thermoanaerobaculia bacterium]